MVGSYLLDTREEVPDWFQFKHHYILHTLDSQLLLQLLTAIAEHRRIKLTNASLRKAEREVVHPVYPLKIFISTQGGRQYLLCWHYRFRKLMFFRLDYIRRIEPGDIEQHPELYEEHCRRFRPHQWGTSVGPGRKLDHIEVTLAYGPGEGHIPRRLEREKRCGTVELPEEGVCRYIADIYDAEELLPWLRTFIGRITHLECSNPDVVRRFYEDLEQMAKLYGGEDG